MPIDPLGGFFPPPVPPDPDRNRRVAKTDRDGRAGHKPEPRSKPRRPPSEAGGEDGDEHRISVEA